MSNAQGEINQSKACGFFEEIINEELEDAKKKLAEWVKTKYNWNIYERFNYSFCFQVNSLYSVIKITSVGGVELFVELNRLHIRVTL